MVKTVVVTGAAGFIGFHLCQRYLAAGFRVVGLDNFCTGSRSHRKALESLGQDNFLFVETDVVQPWQQWLHLVPASWMQSCEKVLHFASPASPVHYLKLSLETMAANSIGLQNALSFADSVKARLVFASTSEVYGSLTQKVQSESQWGCVNSFGPRSCYQEAKRFGEAVIYSHNLRHGTNHGLVRIFNTYGPHMNVEDGRVVINFLMQLHRGQELTVYGDGTQTRSFCYVDDLVEGVLRYADQPLSVPVNLGNPDEMTILKLAHVMSEMFPDRRVSLVHKTLPQEDPAQRCPDVSLAYRMLNGWEPKVPLREGLQKMKAWIEKAAL